MSRVSFENFGKQAQVLSRDTEIGGRSPQGLTCNPSGVENS
jgi:hypothetical protein